MTPDLMEAGAQRLERTQPVAVAATESGGRSAGYARPTVAGEVDDVRLQRGRFRVPQRGSPFGECPGDGQR